MTKFKASDLLMFLAFYGSEVHNGPEILPAFNNYYQDISGGQSTLGNLTLINGERMFMPGEPDPVYSDFNFEWWIDDILISTEHNPTLEDLNPGYQGVMQIRLNVAHLPTGVNYEREEFAYLGFNGQPPNPNITSEYPSQFEVFYTFYPEVDIYEEYAYFVYDFDDDGSVGSADLLTFLANYGNS
jgi:hypothetical protein